MFYLKNLLKVTEIEKAVMLQQKSYLLLKWVADSIRSGFIDFTSAHNISDLPSAAFVWMEQHYENLPVSDHEQKELVCLVTYGYDLLDRMRGIANGPGVLALWRGFAWSLQGSPKKKFTLTADRIMSAQASILATNASLQ